MTEYRPLHAALRDQRLRVHPASEAQEALLQAAGLTGRAERLGDGGQALCGHYRLSQEGRALFVRVTDPPHREPAPLLPILTALRQQRADIIVPRTRAQVGSLLIQAADWFDGNYLPATPEALQRLGTALARLHRQLRKLPEALCSDIRRRTEQREARLRRRFQEVAGAPEWAVAGSDIAGLFRRYPEGLAPIGGVAQPLHGDLNRGNLLHCRDTIRFIDFEDSVHSFFPPVVELAFALERFALLPADSAEQARLCGEALLRSYRQEADETPGHPAETLASLLRWHSLRALTLLTELHRDHQRIPDSEWRKFLHLLEWQCTHAGLLDRLGALLA